MLIFGVMLRAVHLESGPVSGSGACCTDSYVFTQKMHRVQLIFFFYLLISLSKYLRTFVKHTDFVVLAAAYTELMEFASSL